jgi:hypothetical protein
MTFPTPNFGSILLVAGVLLLLLPSPAAAFGAGNIPSIAQVYPPYSRLFLVLMLASCAILSSLDNSLKN